MSGGKVAGTFDVGNPGPGWHAIATGDLAGSGKSDILFQNDSGEIFLWVDGWTQHNQQQQSG
jgi:hypothetical protein